MVDADVSGIAAAALIPKIEAAIDNL